MAHNQVYTCLFYQACKVHDIVYLGYQSANAEKSCHIGNGLDDIGSSSVYPHHTLTETREFTLCIQSRNIIPGRDIKDNIEEAIEGSNSAIIIMSQGFVDSMWCKEEFTHCYIENMKDAAFNLSVIMMQPADTLVNISP